jgi:hypothetical protein
MKVLPTRCPACGEELKVKTLACTSCDTEITGSFELPVFSKLPLEDQQFLLEFIKASGSLKDMAALLKLSYPTVRNRLDEIIERVKTAQQPPKLGVSACKV